MQTNAVLKEKEEKPPSPLPRFFDDNNPPFPHIGVIFGDHRLPDPVIPGGKFTEDQFQNMRGFINVFNDITQYKLTVFDNHETLLEDLNREKPDLIFNLCDNGFRNNARLEMHITAILDIMGIPYTGATTFSLGTCYDKALVGAVARSIGVHAPEETFIAPHGKLPENWNTYPAFIKPSKADNSVGIDDNSLCNTKEELLAQIAKLQKMLPDNELLVQEYLCGNEYRLTMFGNKVSGYHFMPTVQRDYSRFPKNISTYITHEYKYRNGADDIETPAFNDGYSIADENSDIVREMQKMTEKMMERFECYDYMMCDFRADKNGVPKIIDLNPNPGWSKDAFLSPFDAASGYTYTDVIHHIIEVASLRHLDKRKRAAG